MLCLSGLSGLRLKVRDAFNSRCSCLRYLFVFFLKVFEEHDFVCANGLSIVGVEVSSSGVDADLVIEEGLIHVWPIFAGVPEAEETVEQTAAFMDSHW